MLQNLNVLNSQLCKGEKVVTVIAIFVQQMIGMINQISKLFSN